MLLNKICYSYCKCNFTGCLRSVLEFFDALPLGDAGSIMIDEELNRKHTLYLFLGNLAQSYGLILNFGGFK